MVRELTVPSSDCKQKDYGKCEAVSRTTTNHILDVDDSRPASVNSKKENVTWDNTSGDVKVLNTTISEWRLFCTLSDEMIGPNGIRVWILTSHLRLVYLVLHLIIHYYAFENVSLI